MDDEVLICTAYSAAMGASQDPRFLQETFKFLSSKARDQDMFHFFRAIGDNFQGRRLLTKYFQDNYDIVSNDSCEYWVMLIDL